MQKETIIKLETVLDHLSGEEAGQALTALNDMKEILDAAIFTGLGKKNRPAWLLQVLCLPGNEEQAAAAIFRHTHTLGIRRMEMERYVLERRAEISESNNLPAKGYTLEGADYARPEADAVREYCAERGLGTPAFRFAKRRHAPTRKRADETGFSES